MPLTLCVVVLGRYVERLTFLDILLGDRPALTPVESFYQRILAGDADEALDQPSAMKERSLSSYYDEVILKACNLPPTIPNAAYCDRGSSSGSRHRRGLVTSCPSMTTPNQRLRRQRNCRNGGEGAEASTTADQDSRCTVGVGGRMAG
jgi:hypothetical protein